MLCGAVLPAQLERTIPTASITYRTGGPDMYTATRRRRRPVSCRSAAEQGSTLNRFAEHCHCVQAFVPASKCTYHISYICCEPPAKRSAGADIAPSAGCGECPAAVGGCGGYARCWLAVGCSLACAAHRPRCQPLIAVRTCTDAACGGHVCHPSIPHLHGSASACSRSKAPRSVCTAMA